MTSCWPRVGEGGTGEFDLFAQDFGNLVPGSIHGLKFEDVDGDGVFDPQVDVGLGDVTFRLIGTDGQGNNVEQTTLTDSNGEFWFEDLLPGDYSVTEDVPAGSMASTPTKAANEDIRAYRDQVLSKVNAGSISLVDVRAPAEYSGELLAPENLPQEGAQRGGHIPSAANVPWGQAVAEDGTFK